MSRKEKKNAEWEWKIPVTVKSNHPHYAVSATSLGHKKLNFVCVRVLATKEYGKRNILRNKMRNMMYCVVITNILVLWSGVRRFASGHDRRWNAESNVMRKQIASEEIKRKKLPNPRHSSGVCVCVCAIQYVQLQRCMNEKCQRRPTFLIASTTTKRIRTKCSSRFRYFYSSIYFIIFALYLPSPFCNTFCSSLLLLLLRSLMVFGLVQQQHIDLYCSRFCTFIYCLPSLWQCAFSLSLSSSLAHIDGLNWYFLLLLSYAMHFVDVSIDLPHFNNET